jgi:hypothetical protein
MKNLSYSSRCALIVELVEKLHTQGSWCGETHVQKATYIIQEIAKINIGYKFVIYKHGPFSFELSSELSSMRAANIIELSFPRLDYGPSLRATEFGKRVYETNKENVKELDGAMNFVTKWFGSRDVRYLERVATAYFVTQKHPSESVESRAKRINELKAHVDLQAAEEAVKTVDQKKIEAREIAGAIAAGW